MSAILGRTRKVGLGKESTAGIPVAATTWLPHQELSVEDRKDVILDDSALGVRHGAFAVDTDMERAEGNLNGLIYDESFGDIALAAMGAVSSDDHASAVGARVHTLGVANTLPSYTISIKDDNESVRHAFSVLNSLEISVEQGGHARFTSSWLSRKGVATANTPGIVEEHRFRPQDVKGYVADDVAGLDGATVARFKSLNLTINNNLITEPVLGSVAPDYYPGVVETSISFGKLHVDTAFKDLVFGTAKKAIRIVMERTDVEIGTGTPTHPSVVFTFEPGFFSEWNREGGLDDLKQETISAQPIYSFSASKLFDLVITNMKESY